MILSHKRTDTEMTIATRATVLIKIVLIESLVLGKGVTFEFEPLDLLEDEFELLEDEFELLEGEFEPLELMSGDSG
jgi:hypothetical protein